MSLPAINSTAELISIALAGEREAIRRYAELADRMHEFGNDETGTLYAGMVDEERQQEHQLTEWAELAELAINSDIEPIRRDDPNVATTYDAQAVDPNQSTTYRALAFAAHNKERAFHFYAYIAATCTDPGVIATTPDLLAAIVCIEEILVDLMDVATSKSLDLQTLTASAQDFISSSNNELLAGPVASAEVTAALKSITSWYAQKSAAPDDGSTALQRLCTGCDRSFKFYDAVVTSTRDEPILLMAQSLSLHAMERILALRQLNGGSCDQISDDAGK